MSFPAIDPQRLISRLEPPQGRVSIVLDTDTYNEIDDQFALVYALRSSEKLDVQAIYAAPFHNRRSTGPEDGMQKSYEEILRLLSRLNRSPEGFVFKGSTAFLDSSLQPRPSAAASDLIERALATPPDAPLYVVAIGAITNVASAILLEPKIIERIVVVWLGGHALHWTDTEEFNLRQDVDAARVVFDCGVPLVHIPCLGVTSHLLTTPAEIEANVRGRGPIGDYLADIFVDFTGDDPAVSKVLWDLSAVAYLINPSWVPTHLRSRPILTDQCTWSTDHSRGFMRYAHYVRRDPIFRDFFEKLETERSHA